MRYGLRYFGPNGINYDCGKYETVLKGPNGVTCDDLVLLQLWPTLDWFLLKIVFSSSVWYFHLMICMTCGNHETVLKDSTGVVWWGAKTC